MKLIPGIALLLLACTLSPSQPTGASVASSSTPNVVTMQAPPDAKTVVVVMTDDMSPELLVAMNSIGAGTVQFTRTHVIHPICAPSRASFFTGLAPSQHGVVNLSDRAATVFDDSRTLATALDDAGWDTALLGKYLNQYEKLTPWPYVPLGWDRWRVFKTQQAYNPGYVVVTEDRLEIMPPVYSTDYVFGEADTAIRSSINDLFLYVAPFAPHAPATAAARDAGTFSSLPNFRPPSWGEQDLSDKPAYMQAFPFWTPSQIAQRDALRRRQHETLLSVDRGIQRVLQALSDTGRLDGALIMFTSDNGMNYYQRRWSNGHLKNCVYLDCVGVPLLIRAPGITSRVDSTHVVSSLDLPRTILSYAGVPPPFPTKGMDLFPLLADPSAPWREGAYVEILGAAPPGSRMQAVYTIAEMYAEYLLTGEREYYDLSTDPDQMQNRATDPSVAARVTYLRALLGQVRP
jgi:arylsulfatase A-like enzyme